MNANLALPIITLTLLVSGVTNASDSLKLTSPAFSDGESLPIQFTCEGEGISPPLSWSGVPDETESLVVIMDHIPDIKRNSKPKSDRAPEPKSEAELSSKEANRQPPPPLPKFDQPEALRWYWTMYNIPVSTLGVTTGSSVGSLGSNVVNSHNGYAPPCSKGPGKKNYSFHLYALSSYLEMSDIAPNSEATLRKAMDGLVLDSDSLTVSYTRSCQSPPKPQLTPRSEASDQIEKPETAKIRREPPITLPPCNSVVESLALPITEEK